MGCLKCCLHRKLTHTVYGILISWVNHVEGLSQLVKEADKFLTPVVLQAAFTAPKMEYEPPSLKSIIIFFIFSQRAWGDTSEKHCQSYELSLVHHLLSKCVSHRALQPHFITLMKELRTEYYHIQFNNDKSWCDMCPPPPPPKKKHVNLGKLLQIESSTRALETTLKNTNLNLNGFEIFFILPKISFTVWITIRLWQDWFRKQNVSWLCNFRVEDVCSNIFKMYI